jgi:hypothetical protein
MSTSYALCRHRFARFCDCSWSNCVRSVRIELITSHALMSRSVCAISAAIARSSSDAAESEAEICRQNWSVRRAASSAACLRRVAVLARPALESCLRISWCTSGVTSSSIVCPWPMPRMRKAPCARSGEM